MINGIHKQLVVSNFHYIFNLYNKSRISFFFLNQAFAASWFAVFLIAVLYEGLKTFRDMLAKRDICPACNQTENRQQAL